MMFHRTERLFLRPAFPEDWQAVHAAIAREHIVRNLASAPWPYHQDDARAFVCKPQHGWLPDFLVTLPGAGVIGSAGLGLDERGEPSIGYWIAEAHSARGYATEAVCGVLEVARGLGHRRLTASHFLDNPASGRVLLKAGFQPTGEVRPGFSLARGGHDPVACYSIELNMCCAEPGDCLPKAA